MAKRKPFLLRIDERLLAELRRWADQDLRSLNAQIEYLLREAVRRRRGEEEAGEGGGHGRPLRRKGPRNG